MVTEEIETRETISETIAQLAANYKLAQTSEEKVKLKKEAVKFIESVAKGDDEKKEYLAMFDEMAL
jgi:hypothetical protein